MTPEDPRYGGWRRSAIDGVWRRSLTFHPDGRGEFAELWRDSWTGTVPGVQAARMAQANVSRSEARVLRGLHAHLNQKDLWIVLEGQAFVTLVDLRPAMDGTGDVRTESFDAGRGETILIPECVAHGFYARTPLTLMYLVTNEYDGTDELGFAWDDPAIGVPWPDPQPIVSERDAGAPPLAELLARLRGDQDSSSR